MGKIVLFITFVVLIVVSFLIEDDDNHGKPHTGYIGEDWQNKNQIFVFAIFLTKIILNLVQEFKI